MIKRLRLLVTGKVQNVCFRYYTQAKAEELGLVGVVRNLDDGTVEIIAQGETEKLAKLVDWSYRGSKVAQVTQVTEEWVEPAEEFTNFIIEH